MKNTFYPIILLSSIFLLTSSTSFAADPQLNQIIQGMNNLQQQQKELNDNVSARMEGIENVVVKTVRHALDDSAEAKEMAQQAASDSAAAQETAIQVKNDLEAEVATLRNQVVELSQTVATLQDNQTTEPTPQPAQIIKPEPQAEPAQEPPIQIAENQTLCVQMDDLAKAFDSLEKHGSSSPADSPLAVAASEGNPYSAVDSTMRMAEMILASSNTANPADTDTSDSSTRYFDPVMLLAETSVTNFNPGGWGLSYVSKRMVDTMLQKISGRDFKLITIVGHSDPTPHSEFNNYKLAKKRAESAKDYLVEKGIPAEKIMFFSLGDAVSFAPNTSEAGRIENRRVSVRVWAEGS